VYMQRIPMQIDVSIDQLILDEMERYSFSVWSSSK